MAVRSSVYKKQTAGHQHVFGEEKFDAERDLYYRKCSTCSFQQEYEKMWFFLQFYSAIYCQHILSCWLHTHSKLLILI